MLSFQLAFGATCFLLIGAAYAGNGNGNGHACDQTGFIALVDNAQEYLVCDPSPNGDGYVLKRLRCQDNMVFNSELAKCIEWYRDVVPADGGDIENPTIPPDNLEESTSTEPAVTTKITEGPEVTTKITEGPEVTTKVTEGPEVTTKITEGPEVTTKITEDPEVTTKITEGPEVTTKITEDPEVTTKITEDPEVTTKITEDPNATTKITDDPDATTKVTDEPGKPTNPPEPTGTTEQNICGTEGFLPQTGNCSKYLLCYEDASGDLLMKNLDCPAGMQFDPMARFCVKGFNCNATN